MSVSLALLLLPSLVFIMLLSPFAVSVPRLFTVASISFIFQTCYILFNALSSLLLSVFLLPSSFVFTFSTFLKNIVRLCHKDPNLFVSTGIRLWTLFFYYYFSLILYLKFATSALFLEYHLIYSNVSFFVSCASHRNEPVSYKVKMDTGCSPAVLYGHIWFLLVWRLRNSNFSLRLRTRLSYPVTRVPCSQK